MIAGACTESVYGNCPSTIMSQPGQQKSKGIEYKGYKYMEQDAHTKQNLDIFFIVRQAFKVIFYVQFISIPFVIYVFYVKQSLSL